VSYFPGFPAIWPRLRQKILRGCATVCLASIRLGGPQQVAAVRTEHFAEARRAEYRPAGPIIRAVIVQQPASIVLPGIFRPIMHFDVLPRRSFSRVSLSANLVTRCVSLLGPWLTPANLRLPAVRSADSRARLAIDVMLFSAHAWESASSANCAPPLLYSVVECHPRRPLSPRSCPGAVWRLTLSLSAVRSNRGIIVCDRHSYFKMNPC
jgi:hypothetical protein